MEALLRRVESAGAASVAAVATKCAAKPRTTIAAFFLVTFAIMLPGFAVMETVTKGDLVRPKTPKTPP